MTQPIHPHVEKQSGQWRRLKRTLRSAVLIAVGTYLAWCVALYFLQDTLVFPHSMTARPLDGPRYPGTVEYRVNLGSGGTVDAWFVRAPDASAERPGPVAIFFHGNAELIDYQDYIVVGYRRLGISVLLPEYRGYGRSDGRPSQNGIRSDMQQFYSKLTERDDVDAKRIIYHGRSLGGSVAADLATQYKPAAMILQSTCESVAKMARHYAAPPWLVKNPYRTDRVVAKADYPLLIMHGSADELIPVAHGRALRDLAPKALITYQEFTARHNDFPGRGNDQAYWDKIRSFLAGHGVIGG